MRKISLVKICEKLSQTNGDFSFNIWAAAWQNQQNHMCPQQRLRLTCSSVQSDKSPCCVLNGKLRNQGFFMWLAKTQIRLGRCPGWSESLLGTQVISFVLSCCCSFYYFPYFDEIFSPIRSFSMRFSAKNIVHLIKSCPQKSLRQLWLSHLINEPCHEKTCLTYFWPGNTQTGLLSSRDYLETWNCGYSKKRYYTV